MRTGSGANAEMIKSSSGNGDLLAVLIMEYSRTWHYSDNCFVVIGNLVDFITAESENKFFW